MVSAAIRGQKVLFTPVEEKKNYESIQSVGSKLALLLPKHNVLLSQCLKQWGADILFFVVFLTHRKKTFLNGSVSKTQFVVMFKKKHVCFGCLHPMLQLHCIT